MALVFSGAKAAPVIFAVARSPFLAERVLIQLRGLHNRDFDPSMPAVIDLRQVNICGWSSSVVKAFARRRAEHDDYVPDILAAVCGDDCSFGVMRMFGMYADAEGLRDEARFYVSMDAFAAVDWLLQRSSLNTATRSDLLSELNAMT